MLLWIYIRRWLIAKFSELNRKNVLCFFSLYIFTSWFLLEWAGEQHLVSSFTNFIYYIIVTTSTVGYGDMSPVTAKGKWVVSLFVIPWGLGFFALVVSHCAAVMINYFRAGMLGKRKVCMKNHILLLGWNKQRTLHLIRMLQHEEVGHRHIVLCTRSGIENPLPGEIDFVRVNSYTDKQDMDNTNIEQASCILIDTSEDDITLSASLYCASRCSDAHLLVYFKDEALSDLLKMHCPNAECIPAVATEMLAKAAVDPGSSALHQELLSSTRGMTQYSVNYPETCVKTTVAPLFDCFKRNYHATLIAIDSGGGIELNPDLEREVEPGSKLFYIADERIHDFKWKNNV